MATELPGGPSGMKAARVFKRCDDCGLVRRVDPRQYICCNVVYGRGRCIGALSLHGDCHSVIFHGPGHQSTTRCARNHALDPVIVNARAPEPMHCAIVMGQHMCWHGNEAFTGYFDEPPPEDQP